MRKGCGWLTVGAIFFITAFAGSAQDPAASKNPGFQSADALPPRALSRFGTSRWRHGSRVQTIAFAPSGRLIAAAGGNDPIRLWDATTGQQVRTCNEPWTYALAFSTRGTVLFSGGALKTIRMWETDTGKEFAQLTGHTSAIKALAVSPDGSMLASGSQDGTILLWEILHRKVMATFKGHADEITSLAFSPDRDSTYLVSGSSDRTIRVWHVDQQKMVQRIDAGRAVASVAFVDDKIIAGGGDANDIQLWDVTTGKAGQTLAGHQGPISALAVTRDFKRLISSSADATVRVWDLAGRKELATIKRHAEDGEALALSKDGQLVACGGGNNTLRVFETQAGKEQLPGQGLQAGLANLVLAPDGRNAGIRHDDRNGDDLGGATAASSLRAGRPTSAARSCWPTRRTALVLATASKKNPVTLWDTSSGKQGGEVPAKNDDDPLALAFAPVGNTLAVGYRSARRTSGPGVKSSSCRSPSSPCPVACRPSPLRRTPNTSPWAAWARFRSGTCPPPRSCACSTPRRGPTRPPFPPWPLPATRRRSPSPATTAPSASSTSSRARKSAASKATAAFPIRSLTPATAASWRRGASTRRSASGKRSAA